MAEASRIAADLKIIQNAADLHFAEKGTYAASTDVLKTAGYLKDVPADPKEETPDKDYYIDTTTHDAAYGVAP